MITVFDYDQIQIQLSYDSTVRELFLTVRNKERLVHTQGISLPWLLRELNVLGGKDDSEVRRPD